MHNNAKNDLEATTLQEVGKLELIVAEVRKLGATDVAGRSGLSRAGGRSGALRLSGGSGLALRLLSSKELVLTVDVGVGEARSDDGDTHLIAQGLVDNGTEDDVGLGSTALATTSAASLISWMPRSLEPAMESSTRVAPSMELSSSGLEMACWAASTARVSPEEVPIPIMAVPACFMMVLTSAKSD